jgi:hypothetical protein
VIHFIGLSFAAERVDAACLGRNMTLSHEVSTAVFNVRRDAAAGVALASPSEWVRAGSYALQEAYLGLPVSYRKIWGIGLAGVSGWIALDLEFAPLADIHLVEPEEVPVSIRRWLEENPRLRQRISVVLSPKDYFRFATSGALAADVTQASRQGLLQEGRAEWSSERLAREEMEERWMPPVFESAVATSRISEDGMARTNLPGGIWLVAGALGSAAAMVSTGDLREGRLWAPDGAGRIACGIPQGAEAAAPPGWAVRPSAIAGCRILERRVEPEKASGGALEAVAAAAVEELEAAGLRIAGIERSPGRADIGAAALAGIAAGLIRSWDFYYKNAPPLPPPGAPEPPPGSAAPPRLEG